MIYVNNISIKLGKGAIREAEKLLFHLFSHHVGITLMSSLYLLLIFSSTWSIFPCIKQMYIKHVCLGLFPVGDAKGL